MYETIISLLIQFGLQTVFLTVALWIMIKLQSLNYNFLGLLGAAALASVLDRVLELTVGHFLGIYFSSYVTTPIVVAVLFACLKKVTQADRTDVCFTIGVGYAVWFVINLFFMGALMGDLRGDLRLSAREKGESVGSVAEQKENAQKETAAVRSSDSDTKSQAAAPAPAVTSSELIAKQFAVKGVTRNGNTSSVTLQSGKKTYSVFMKQATLIETTEGLASVSLTALNDRSLTLDIGGSAVNLPLP